MTVSIKEEGRGLSPYKTERDLRADQFIDACFGLIKSHLDKNTPKAKAHLQTLDTLLQYNTDGGLRNDQFTDVCINMLQANLDNDKPRMIGHLQTLNALMQV